MSNLYKVLFLVLTLPSCALLMSYDGAHLSDSESAKVKVQSNLQVVAFKKKGTTADEDRLGLLNWNSKIPAGRYRLEVSIDEEGFGSSFIPVSLNLHAMPNSSYWIAYEKEYGFSNKWRPYVATSEPEGFYGLFDFWKKGK